MPRFAERQKVRSARALLSAPEQAAPRPSGVHPRSKSERETPGTGSSPAHFQQGVDVSTGFPLEFFYI